MPRSAVSSISVVALSRFGMAFLFLSASALPCQEGGFFVYTL